MTDLRAYSGRGTDEVLTEFINKRILTELSVGAQDRLVDIGCGDGTLLRLALQQGVGAALGLTGGEDEAERLRALGLDVKQPYSDSLPLPDGCASVVVCNSVLHIVPENKIGASLREIARIAEGNARIWIGEIPQFREPASVRTFASIPEMLWWLLPERGARAFLGMCRRVATGAQKEPVLRTAQAFWAEPETFIEMAGEAGLKVERHFPHQRLDGGRRPQASETRWDYVPRK